MVGVVADGPLGPIQVFRTGGLVTDGLHVAPPCDRLRRLGVLGIDVVAVGRLPLGRAGAGVGSRWPPPP